MMTYEKATLWSVDKLFCTLENKPQPISLLTTTVMAMVRLELKMPDINEQMVLNALKQMMDRGYLCKEENRLYMLPTNIYNALILLEKRSKELLPGFKAELAHIKESAILTYEAAIARINAIK